MDFFELKNVFLVLPYIVCYIIYRKKSNKKWFRYDPFRWWTRFYYLPTTIEGIFFSFLGIVGAIIEMFLSEPMSDTELYIRIILFILPCAYIVTLKGKTDQ